MLPIILNTSFLVLYSYPLFMGLAWGFGYYFTKAIFLKYSEVEEKKLTQLFLGLFIFSWIGAKAFFLWFSSGPKIYQYLYANYFWLGGGFVFYGGLVFATAFYLFWSIGLKKFPFLKSYLLLPGLAFGHAIGRLGCFLTGCCYGKITESFLGVDFPNGHRYPVQLFEAISLFIIGKVVLDLIKNNSSNKKIIYTYFVSYSAVRFVIEFFRGDEIRGIFMFGLSSSQMVSIVLIISILLLESVSHLIENRSNEKF